MTYTYFPNAILFLCALLFTAVSHSLMLYVFSDYWNNSKNIKLYIYIYIYISITEFTSNTTFDFIHNTIYLATSIDTQCHTSVDIAVNVFVLR